MVNRGTLVWGKMKSFPWWPAIVIDPEDCGRDRVKNNKLWLFWFGDHKITQVNAKNVLDFEEHFEEKCIEIQKRRMEKAIEEVLIISAKHHQFECTDFSSLIHWANNGFKTSSGLFCNGANKELPDIVLQSLQKDDFKRKETEDTDESDDEICKVTNMVRNGSRTLEDICIVCCKLKSFVNRQHPLFIGGVCQNCKKCVDKINKTQFGHMQEICVICSQGGKLVYCSNNICLRSYCELCLDYMVCRGTYLKAVKMENWKCYLCKPDSNKNCLIRRRNKYKSKIIPVPPFPKAKLPINVIAQNDAVHTVLEKKKIDIDAYFTDACLSESSESSESRHQKHVDFSNEQFSNICADLVYGSFFTTSQDVKRDVKLLASAFYKFIYRLDNAKLHKPSVFFIFTSDVGLNSEIISRVLRFIEVDPFTVNTRGKEFFIWSNIPNRSYKNCRYLQLKLDENESVEEEIVSKFVDPLRRYFKLDV